jgi:hypothetical protein
LAVFSLGSLWFTVVDFFERYETVSHRYVLGDPRLLSERRIYPATVADEAGLHSMASSIGYLLQSEGSQGKHA